MIIDFIQTLDFLQLQPSQFPSLVTDLTWDTQISADYMENSGKLRIGSKAYNFEQVSTVMNTFSIEITQKDF
jgi:hypothetical protein